jgi:hypothetical protein
MKYEFRPFAKGNHILVSLTGKVYEKGEHPEYIKYKVIEVIDDYGNKIDAFEDELTNILVEPKQETIEDGANKWVFETNADRWSNNDDTAGDNYGSFIAGVKSDVAKNYWYAKFKDENGLKNIK